MNPPNMARGFGPRALSSAAWKCLEWTQVCSCPDAGLDSPWKGVNASAEVVATARSASRALTADTQHFWRYELDYAPEVKSEADVINHCRIVMALRKDLGM